MRGLWKHVDVVVPLVILCLLVLAKPDEAKFTGGLVGSSDAVIVSQAHEPRADDVARLDPDDQGLIAQSANTSGVIFPTPLPPIFEVEPDFENLDGPLADIVVEGTKAVHSSMVLALMETRKGHFPDRQIIERDVRELYDWGWFSSVVVIVEQTTLGPVLVVKVVEKPSLEVVMNAGDKQLRDELRTEHADFEPLRAPRGVDEYRIRLEMRRKKNRDREMRLIHARDVLDEGVSPEAIPREIADIERAQGNPGSIASKGNELREPARLNTSGSPFVGRLAPAAGSGDSIVPVGGDDAELEEPARLQIGDAAGEAARSFPPPPAVVEHDADSDNLSEPLSAIVIEGNKRVTTEEIMELIETRVGEVPRALQIKNDVRALIAKRWFSSVVPRVEKSNAGPALVVTVVERPVLEKVTYIGNKYFSDDRLAAITGLEPGKPHDVFENRMLAELIETMYHGEGHIYARVELEKADAPDDREVVFKIDEGPLVVVSKITFDGNASVPAAVLRSQVETASPMTWLSGGICDTHKIAEDEKSLKDYYQRLGFFDVEVWHREGFADDDFSKMHLEFMITEGPRYKVRDIEFIGNEALSDRALRAWMKQRENAFYDQRLIDADTNEILARYGALRRFFATVEANPRSWYTEEPGFVDLVYHINEDVVYPDIADVAPGNGADVGLNGPIVQAAATAPADADEPPGLRDVGQLLFQGLSIFPASEIRDSLSRDFEVLNAEHPEIALATYLATIEKQVRSGHQHHGFRDARVEAVYDRVKQQIVVRVNEGKRCRCRDVQIVGASSILAAKLIAALTEGPKPSRILWKKGEPVHFDELAAPAIRKQIEDMFGEAGFLSPQFSVVINRVADGKFCDLAVTVASEGPRAVLGKIDVKGTKRDSAEDVVKYLDLKPGMPYDTDLQYRLQRRLRDSGRYLTVAVEPAAHDSPDLATARRTRDLHIRLREYKDAPPLTSELLPEEQALLKLREWLEKWGRGETDEDIVVTASIHPDLGGAPGNRFDHVHPPLNSRMVLAPNRGQTISLSALRPDGKSILDMLFAVYPDRLVFAAPQRGVKLQLPNSATDRVIFNMEGSAASAKAIERGDQRFRLSFGLGFSTFSKPNPSAFEVKARFSPVFAISMAHEGKAQSALRDGVWKICSDLVELQFEAATGRPVELRLIEDSEWLEISIRAQKNALQSEMKTVEAALNRCAISYDPASPWKSRLEFFIDDWCYIARQAEWNALGERIAAAIAEYDPASPWDTVNAVGYEIQECLIGEEGPAEGVESLRALRKLVHRWSPPAIADLDAAPGGPSSPDSVEPFWIPSYRAGWNYDDLLKPGSLSRKNAMAGVVLPIYRKLVPRTGWMWPVGRDAVLYWSAQAAPPTSRLLGQVSSFDHGPLGDFVLGSLDTLFLGTFDMPVDGAPRGFNARLIQNAGRTGLLRLSAAAFARDYDSLLEGDSWLGRWCLSTASALRELNESELRALARLLPDDVPREAIVQCLLRLRAGRDKPIEKVLPAAFDALWSEVLFEPVRSALFRMANLADIRPDMLHRDDQVRQASAEEDADVQPAGELRPVPLSEAPPEPANEIPELIP